MGNTQERLIESAEEAMAASQDAFYAERCVSYIIASNLEPQAAFEEFVEKNPTRCAVLFDQTNPTECRVSYNDYVSDCFNVVDKDSETNIYWLNVTWADWDVNNTTQVFNYIDSCDIDILKTSEHVFGPTITGKLFSYIRDGELYYGDLLVIVKSLRLGRITHRARKVLHKRV